MKILNIFLQNFRNIVKEKYTLNEHFTVFIGENGSGKSTWLNAIKVACGAFFISIPEVNNRGIANNEIRLSDAGKHLIPNKPVVVKVEGKLFEKKDVINWQRSINEDGSRTAFSCENSIDIRQVGKDKYNKMLKGDDIFDLPVIAFFGVSRLSGGGRTSLSNKARLGREIFKEGYSNWEEIKSTSHLYPRWLLNYDMLLAEGKEYEHTKSVFFDTIKKAVPFIQEITERGGELYLKIKIGNKISDFLPLNLHSDGINSFVGMVAELTFRCIVLNGRYGKNAVEKSYGVVLIDELDLHLHPSWQRHVVADLKEAFPNIQFVAATHSLFIVQSLKANELINLDADNDNEPQDLDIVETAYLMGVDSAYNIKNQKQEDVSFKYLELLNSTEDVADKLNQIEVSIADPAVRAFLKMQRLEKQFNAKNK